MSRSISPGALRAISISQVATRRVSAPAITGTDTAAFTASTSDTYCSGRQGMGPSLNDTPESGRPMAETWMACAPAASATAAW